MLVHVLEILRARAAFERLEAATRLDQGACGLAGVGVVLPCDQALAEGSTTPGFGDGEETRKRPSSKPE